MAGTYQRASIHLASQVPDLLPADAPADAWNSVQNISFSDGFSSRSSADVPIFDGYLDLPRTLIYTVVNTIPFWVYAGDNGIFAYDGTTHFDITPVGWTVPEASLWTATSIGGLVVINCSSKDPYWWDGNVLNPCTVLPDWPVGGRCYAMRVHKNFLFAIGLYSSNPARVMWSAASELGQIPQSWTPDPANLAGDVDLDPAYSPALDGMTLRDSFLIYKGQSIFSFNFIGGQFVFGVRKLFAERGVVSVNSIVRMLNDTHVFIGFDGDVYKTDGVSCISLLDGRMQRAFYNDFSSNPSAIFSMATLPRLKLAMIAYPDSTSEYANKSIIYDDVTGALGNRQVPDIWCAAEGSELTDVGLANEWEGDPNSWNSDPGQWNTVLAPQTRSDVIVGGANGFHLISTGDAGTFAPDVEIEAIAIKEGISFGDPQQWKLVTKIWPKIEGEPGDVIVFRIGGQANATGPTTWGPEIPFVIGSNDTIDTFTNARWLSIQVQSNGGSPWKMGSFDVEFRPTGRF